MKAQTLATGHVQRNGQTASYLRIMKKNNTLQAVVVDREEVVSSREFNALYRLTGCKAHIEIPRDFSRLANPSGRLSDTKNPASVAALGGVQMGLAQHSRPKAFYPLPCPVATSEARR